MPDDAPLHGDLSVHIRVDTSAMDWTPSPGGQVDRKRVHRVGPAESGQVTSVVRYRPGARFPEHDHPEGEEILVLEGVFSDHAGDATPGTHLMNVEGFRHAPWSDDGCVIFVKLRQYDGEARPYRRTDTRGMDWVATPCDGVDEKLLAEADGYADRTALERWRTGAAPGPRTFDGGLELFVIEGALEDERGRLGAGSWARWPAGASVALRAVEETVVYAKADGVAGLRSA